VKMSETPDERKGDVADLILFNGKIITVDQKNRTVEAVAIRKGRILELGDNEFVTKLAGSNTRKVDLNGKTVTPGLVDSHCHLAEAGMDAVFVLDLKYPKVTKIRDMVKLLQDRARRTVEDEWIQGSGWNETVLDERRYPTRWDLDPVSASNPVILRHVTGHCVVVNSLALKMARINKDTPEPAGGTIVRDETGEPTGVLKEFPAMNLALRLLPECSTAQWMEGIRYATQLFVSEGVTSVKENYPRSDYARILAAYRKLIAKREMKVRSYLMCRAETIEDVHYAAAHPRDFKTHPGEELLKLGGIKILLDGSLVARTAWMHDEYYDPATEKTERGNRGYPVISEENLSKIIEAANANGFQIAVHAIGDKATDAVLDAYQKALERKPRKNHRHSIIHALLPTPDAVNRIRNMGIVIETQAPFLYFLADGYARSLPPHMLKRVIPLRTFLESGITVGNGSDAPYCPDPPRYGLWAACTRRSLSGLEGERYLGKSECIGIEDALRTYTVLAAKCLMLDDKIGSLEKGKLADLVVWDRDMLSIPADDVKDLRALMTIIDGKIVFERENAESLWG
jgi:predicted amidohydrolase YtcJ